MTTGRMSGMFGIPLFMYTDTYKISHSAVYPEASKMVAYAECRTGYDGDLEDERILFYGMRHVIENYVAVQWTVEDVDKAEVFFQGHNAGHTPLKFPKDLFLKFIRENNGYFPVKIEALPEGTVIYPHVPVYQITAEEEYSRLCTFLETVLTMVWYPTTVATLSRRVRDLIEAAYERTVDESDYWSLDSRLHDFGFRGCTCLEQSIVGGVAHLVNFNGTDTLTAAYHAQFHLNNGKPVGESIPATEHSVMMSFQTEKDAILAMIREFGHGTFAVVMDTYDYAHALEAVLPAVGKAKTGAGGFLVIRPDSGDPVETVLHALRCAEKVFGSRVNGKGFKVLNGCGVIQGDSVTYLKVRQILRAVEAAGFSVQNIAMGMGSGLLQKLNRDTLSFATKLCHIRYADGTVRDVLKYPKTEHSKMSLPGEFVVRRVHLVGGGGIPVVYPKEDQLNDAAKVADIRNCKHAGITQKHLIDHPEELVTDAAAAVGIRHYKHSGIPEMGIVVDNADEIAAAALNAASAIKSGQDNLLQPVYDHGPLLFGTAPDGQSTTAAESCRRAWDSFETIRRRAYMEWRRSPKTADVISSSLKAKVDKALQELRSGHSSLVDKRS